MGLGGERGVSLHSPSLHPVASLLLRLSKWLIQTSGPELSQKAVTSAAAAEPWLQIYVSVYVRVKSYRQRALMLVLARSDELLTQLLNMCLSLNKKGFKWSRDQIGNQGRLFLNRLPIFEEMDIMFSFHGPLLCSQPKTHNCLNLRVWGEDKVLVLWRWKPWMTSNKVNFRIIETENIYSEWATANNKSMDSHQL